MPREQRRFERLVLPDDARAVDDDGRELGRVAQASGGGMLIHTGSEQAAAGFHPGQRLRITVVEPRTDNRHTLSVVVRYRKGEAVGVEFSGREGASS
ncbi:MAG TPA: PilZ domain-containing protein [Terriglobales bacterium]|nr:PilZ domain-containing protein [Terriglobales bacterium]